MTKQKDDRATLELEGLPRPKGRPKGTKEPLTAAEKMRAYRERKAKEGIKEIQLTQDERHCIRVALGQLKEMVGESSKIEVTELIKKFQI